MFLAKYATSAKTYRMYESRDCKTVIDRASPRRYRQDITTNSASMPMQPQGGPPQGWGQPGQPGQPGQYAMQPQPQYKPPGKQYG